MNLIPFLSFTTLKLAGIQICPHCGSEDLFFGFENQCMDCHKPIKSHDKLLTLSYSLQVLIEFISKYDDQLPEDGKFHIVNELRRNLQYLTENGFLTDERLKSMKYLIQSYKSIGNIKFHARVQLIEGKSSLDFDFELPNGMERIKTISAVICALINLQIIKK